MLRLPAILTAPGEGRRLLRELPGRRVWREGGVVVKAFRHPSLCWRWRDRWRARRELLVLSFLHARGLPVPRPIGVERVDGWWRARLEWLEGARTLEELLDAGAAAELSSGRLAARLGTAVGRLHVAGVDQPDFHAGNFLVDRAGEIWAIDFHKARLRARLGKGRLLASLARLGGELRERTPPRVRARFFAAWWRALTPALRAGLPPRTELARDLERRARADRLEAVRENLDRWLRPSERCERVEGPPGELRLVRAGLDASPRQALIDALAGAPAPASVLARPGARGPVRARWLAAARLVEHGLPVARPAALRLSGPHSLALYDLPWSAAPSAPPVHAAAERRRGELAALRAAALERGLIAPAEAEAWVAALEIVGESSSGALACLPGAV